MNAALLAGTLVAWVRFQDGFEDPCQADPDADRLVTCTEVALGTDPFDADTDADGLSDGDEVLGTVHGLDLPALGTLPRRKDVLLEIDWVDDNAGCAFHSHRPRAEMVAQVQAMFADLPIANPDGSTGIRLIVDHGQGPPFTGGNVLAAPAGNVSLAQLQVVHQPAHFDKNRLGYFRYAIHAHRLGQGEVWSGVAAGDAHIVSLQCFDDTPGYMRNVVIHELGHNLGLQHGGDTACNRKPNYNSLMNYTHLFHGLDLDCDRLPDGVDAIGFSRGTRIPLVKSQLIEADGVCAPGDPQAKGIDWNANGVIDLQPVAVDLACPGLDVLHDWNDLAALQLPLFTPPNAAEPPPVPPGEACPEPPTPGVPP